MKRAFVYGLVFVSMVALSLVGAGAQEATPPAETGDGAVVSCFGAEWEIDEAKGPIQGSIDKIVQDGDGYAVSGVAFLRGEEGWSCAGRFFEPDPTDEMVEAGIDGELGAVVLGG